MLNVQSAASWYSKGQTLELKGDELLRCGSQEKLKRFLFKSYDRKQISKVADYIQGKLSATEGESKQQYFVLADAFVKRYAHDVHGKKIARVFDRTIVTDRREISFYHQDNQASYRKWLRYNMPSDVYHRHPEFCTFLETSGLLSQMKVTRDKVAEIDGEGAILVEGEWMKWSELKEDFEVVKSKHFHEKFILNKETSEVYTYLDNGKGLQLHHPFLSENNPTSTINDSEYERVLSKAHAFVRSGEEGLDDEQRKTLNAKRPFVIQLVTSYVKGPNTRMHELLQNKKHPYLRLVIGEDIPERGVKKGDVFEVGYGWKNKVPIPLIASQGRFRSPDVWEYTPCEERVVTNIPITMKEAKAFSDYTLQYHRRGVNLGDPIGFQLARQNCSTYVRASLSAAGIKVPTEINLKELIARITPKLFVRIGSAFCAVKNKTYSAVSWTAKVLPKCVRQTLSKITSVFSRAVTQLIETLAAISLIPANFVLGGAAGKGGAAFVPPHAPDREIKPSLSNWKQWFSLSSYRFNLPGILQEWQRQQASTVIYNRPIQLTIVP